MEQPNNNLPLVAIGMKTYNRAGYLKQALNSLLAQTYKNFILIVSDNGSRDGTQAFCEELARHDKRICYVRHEQNMGVFPNFNFTIRETAATADYCVLVSDDDLWEPIYLEKCMGVLLKDPEAVVAFSDFANRFHDGRIERFDPRLYFPLKRDLYERLKEYLSFYSIEGKGTTVHGIWRKKAIEKEIMGTYYEHDVSFVMRCLSRGPFVFVDELLFYKGVLPGRESTKDQPLTALRLIQSFGNRFDRVGTEFRNIWFILGIKELSLLQRFKLSLWEAFVMCRLFVLRKT